MSYLLVLILTLGFGSAYAADTPQSDQESLHRQIELEVEPVAYLLGGAGGHLRFLNDNLRFSLEVFGLNIPQTLHGHDAFDVSVIGAEIHFEYFLENDRGGWFLGPEIGMSKMEVTHRQTDETHKEPGLSAGVRGGYRWYPDWGNFYFAPVAGLVYSFSNDSITLSGDTFESGPFTPFVTIGLGYSFEL